MKIKPIRTGIIGAGMISEIYLKNMIHHSSVIQVEAIASAHNICAVEKAEKYGIRAVTVEEMLQDTGIQMVVILTPVQEHYQLIKDALHAGKHVYTEKTLTDNLGTAKELLILAREKELWLGAAPDTFLGARLQTARKVIDEGMIGQVTSIVATANRQNDIILSNYPFLRIPGCGLAYDYGVYYVTAMVSLFGSVCRTAAFVDNPFPVHLDSNPDSPEVGKEFRCENESRVSAILQFENGMNGTLHLNANSILVDQAMFAVYGTKGILYLGSPNEFGGKIIWVKNGDTTIRETLIEELPLNFPYEDNSRGIGAADLAEAIRNGKESRVSAEMAYHVLEVLSMILTSGESGRFQEIVSRCEKPEQMHCLF